MNVDELICRALHGRVSEDEAAELLAWRRASARNETYYRNLVAILEEAARADEELDARDLTAAPSGRDLIARAENRRSDVIGPAATRRRMNLVRLGAIPIAAGLASLLLLTGRFWDESAGASGLPGQITTGPAESRTLTLAAGTAVLLAPASRFAVAETDDPAVLEATLDGHAYFVVARNDGRRFRVRTRLGDVVVRGTRFDLEAREEHLRLLVVEGDVELGAMGRTINVGMSQVGEIHPSLPPVRRDVDEDFVRRELSWVGTFVVFDDTPLAEAADELARIYGVPVEVTDSTLLDETVHGVFRDESLDEVLRVLCPAISARCTTGPSGTTIGL